MTATPPRAGLKSSPDTVDQPDSAITAVRLAPTCGREKVARQGVLSALPPDQPPSAPPPGDGRFPVAWLHIHAPYGATPTATSKCLCGRDHSAIGRRKVLDLITDHAAHRDACPLRTTQAGRNAA
ncbi:hypothetical protein PGH47_29055 [Streptomyces sp. HUAS 31]|uniref:hypothetical protein n=1 Tax=Streptomyces sp. HUAS 31 TaxID=3020055 RepID=UPI002306947F|nr:hypothetical protein [Streptomyces sp. HUAS 31]WCD99494.1 hypothetical protein PGH47_29055 [Streptomyces sp. HUAS 31]